MVGICLGPYGGPREVGVSYERGTPVASRHTPRANQSTDSIVLLPRAIACLQFRPLLAFLSELETLSLKNHAKSGRNWSCLVPEVRDQLPERRVLLFAQHLLESQPRCQLVAYAVCGC